MDFDESGSREVERCSLCVGDYGAWMEVNRGQE